MGKAINIGDVVGCNVVIGQSEQYVSPQGKRHNRWKLKCNDCGRVKTTDTGIINQGRASSCRCKMQSEEITKRRAESNIKVGCGVREVFGDYVRGAVQRGYEFSLTLQDVDTIVSQDCHYCGQPPSMVKKRANNFLHNGIDRKDNNLGYIIDNVVPCCKVCNRIKHVLSKQDFLTHIKRIIEYTENENYTT
jgi:5-methylcytosine-specific restriction endonuclease McrA